MYDLFFRRHSQDALAFWVHVLAVVGIAIADALNSKRFFFTTLSGGLLLGVELVTAGFHFIYYYGAKKWFNFEGHRNPDLPLTKTIYRIKQFNIRIILPNAIGLLQRTTQPGSNDEANTALIDSRPKKKEMTTELNKHRTQNWLKWIEYSLSATCGSLAVMSSQGTVHGSYVVGVIAAGALQQSVGWLLERNRGAKRSEYGSLWWLWAVAWLCQSFEYAVVYDELRSHGGDLPVSYFVYAVLWFAFGGLATLDLILRQCNRMLDIDTIEAWYAFLSWVAKISVLLTVYLEWRP